MRKKTEGFEVLEVNEDNETGARTFIAVHSTALGPGLGGIRLFHYRENTYGCEPEKAAEKDALRLARAMTYKASMAGLMLGGGKSVILADPDELGAEERKGLFERFGRAIESLGGDYIAAEDVGTTEKDMESARKTTRFVTGVPGEAGDPSPVTAFGVLRGMQACALHCFGSESLKGKTVAVQGVGSVGFSLASLLAKDGAKILAADTDGKKADRAEKELGAEIVEPREIIEQECDILSPCAFGEVINRETVKKLNCRIIAGAANNQLESPEMGGELFRKGIVYAPDYAINCGGLISVANEKVVTGTPYDRGEVMERTEKTFNRVLDILERSSKEGKPSNEIADRIAKERIERERKGKSREA